MSSRTIATALGAALLLAAGTAVAKEPKEKLAGVVNLNTATASQLELLPGVGPKVAEKIVAYRGKEPFRRIEDLVKVKGIGKKLFEKMRAHLAVSGETTLKLEKAEKAEKTDAQAQAAPPER